MSLWIYTDADNTLWDTDAVFADAQLALLEGAEALAEQSAPSESRLEFVREYDQAIAARHHARLRYPPALLARALHAGILGATREEAARRVLAEGSLPTEGESAALRTYASALSKVPPLLPGVREGLELARDADVPVSVVTEGPLELVRGRLHSLELDSLTAGALSATKSPELYARLVQRAAPRRALMIGDQPDRDIQMAHAVGMQTVWVRSRFRPVWTRDIDSGSADAVVESFLQAIEWALNRPATEGT